MIKLLDKCQDPQSTTPSLVFEWVDNVDFRKLYPKVAYFTRERERVFQ